MKKAYASAVVLGCFVITGHAYGQSSKVQGQRFECNYTDHQEFSLSGGQNCREIPVEADYEPFFASPEALVDVSPSSLIRDGNSVKLWVRIYLNKTYPYVTSAGVNKGRYDGMKGVYKLICGQRQQVIMQADYLLAGEPIYYRLSNEAVTEEIEPGSLVDFLYKKYCS